MAGAEAGSFPTAEADDVPAASPVRGSSAPPARAAGVAGAPGAAPAGTRALRRRGEVGRGSGPTTLDGDSARCVTPFATELQDKSFDVLLADRGALEILRV
mmetsp:Transcript_39021/g.123857  ORF Transcript_39021/g.123857 Transcript_39021/m.123857 type:complete len:101 (-) Transcript_39021:2946-3248(-)